MFSDLKPLFDQIDEYYKEVNVSLLAEERRLNAIRRSLRVTPDDRLRWEHIRDACNEASRLLAVEESHTIQALPASQLLVRPVRPAASAIRTPHRHATAAATDQSTQGSSRTCGRSHRPSPAARDRLRQTHANIVPLTHHPQTDLLRLMSEYENGEKTCRQRIRRGARVLRALHPLLCRGARARRLPGPPPPRGGGLLFTRAPRSRRGRPEYDACRTELFAPPRGSLCPLRALPPDGRQIDAEPLPVASRARATPRTARRPKARCASSADTGSAQRGTADLERSRGAMGQPIIAALALINPIQLKVYIYYFPLGHTQLETVGHSMIPCILKLHFLASACTLVKFACTIPRHGSFVYVTLSH
ncbi:hypothetical protein EDB89DRAFT_1587250 [Lactarius sanguifluus]|nr:hypothetical protein EDB89DRAFT_1587250 [Lactarius sanguifluus]